MRVVNQDQSSTPLRRAAQKRAQRSLFLNPPPVRTGAGLQRLDTVEDEQHTAGLQRLGDLLGFSVGRAGRVRRPSFFSAQSRKRSGTTWPVPGALVVKGPAKDHLRSSPTLGP